MNYSTYSAAQNGTAMVGKSSVFWEQAAPVGGVDFNTSYHMGFLDMPAIDMRPSLQGDCNLDGRVDINDLTIVLSHYGLADMTWKTGDLIGQCLGRPRALRPRPARPRVPRPGLVRLPPP